MIKANELRIGNWFQFEEKYLQSTAINDVMVVSDNYGFEYFELDKAKPIKLTPYILLKCGFSETINNRDSGYRQIGKIVNGHDFMFTIECNHIPEFYFDMVGTEVNYLHQLQNLYFALTGNELDFKP